MRGLRRFESFCLLGRGGGVKIARGKEILVYEVREINDSCEVLN